MDRLPSVIGPAPSELSSEALMKRLRTERSRVQETLQFFRDNSTPSKRRKKGPSMKAKATKLDDVMKATGLSIEEIMAKIKELPQEDDERSI